MNFRPFILLSMALFAGQASGQVNITHAGYDQGGNNQSPQNQAPRNLGAIQDAMPGARVSHIGPDGQLVPYAGRTGGPLPSTSGMGPGGMGLGQQGQGAPSMGQPAPAAVDPSPSMDPNEGRDLPPSQSDLAERAAAIWGMGAVSQSIRQSGLSTGRGDQLMVSIAGSSAPDDRRALYRWKTWLPQFGVDPAKITFESRRLSRASFDAWASRFVWEACHDGSYQAPGACAQLSNP